MTASATGFKLDLPYKEIISGSDGAVKPCYIKNVFSWVYLRVFD